MHETAKKALEEEPRKTGNSNQYFWNTEIDAMVNIKKEYWKQLKQKS